MATIENEGRARDSADLVVVPAAGHTGEDAPARPRYIRSGELSNAPVSPHLGEGMIAFLCFLLLLLHIFWRGEGVGTR
jgi:hypothetical protein